MLKIKKITIENFRGIKQPIEIDFIRGTTFTSAVVYGRNGTGKSSITDSWEWFNNFKIAALSKEGVSEKDYSHKSSAGVNSYVSVDFAAHSTIHSAKAAFNPSRSTTPTTTGQYDDFKALSLYPNYLRYSDLQDFVYKTKTEKYKYIAKFFGLEAFQKNQSDLQTYIGKLALKIAGYKNLFNTQKSNIQKILNKGQFLEQDVIDFFNSVALKHGLTTISQFKESKRIIKHLQKIVTDNPKTKELTEWKAFQLKLNKFYPLSSLKKGSEDLETIFNDLKKDAESITQLVLSKLYTDTIDTIPKLENQTICPVCDQFFEGNLLEHVQIKHQTLSEIQKKKTAFDYKKIEIERLLTNMGHKISAFRSETSLNVLTHFEQLFIDLGEIYEALPIVNETFKKQITDIDKLEISSMAFVAKYETLISAEKEVKKVVFDKVKALEEDPASKSLADDFGNSKELIKSYFDFLVLTKKLDLLEEIKTNTDSLFSELTTEIKNKIQTTFSTISTDVVEYFTFLENSNSFLKNPQLKLIVGVDKAVELEIEFMNEKITPAFKFLSESQINSFGLAIFLAGVKHFNREFKFIILDDVVNSFDNFKRPRVSQLIAQKFNDFQVLILTHDQVFFDTIQRDFPNWSRYKFTSWDYTIGPRYRLSKNYVEEIQTHLDNDEPIPAGQSLGRYLEWTFGVLCQNLKIPIPYKIENIYTLAEYFDPLKAKLKKYLQIPNKVHKLCTLIDELEIIFRNYCAHWKNESTPFTKEEIGDVFNKWIEIEQLMYCTTCKSFVQLQKLSSGEYVKCDCGTIDLKSPAHYG